VLIANDHARYIDANHAATLLTGYTHAELLKMDLWRLTPEGPGRLGPRLWRAFLKRGRMRGNYRLRCKDGSVLTARYVAVANVLPGVHLSALTTPELMRTLARRKRRRTRSG
jgi:PAS domain S-box-containing protein